MRARPGAHWMPRSSTGWQLGTDPAPASSILKVISMRPGAESMFVTWSKPWPGGAVGRVRAGSRNDADDGERQAAEKALAYMDLRPGTPMRDIAVDVVFVGSGPTVGSKICGGPATYCVAAGVAPGCGCSSFRAPCGCARRPKPKGWVGKVFTAAGAEWLWQAGLMVPCGCTRGSAWLGAEERRDVNGNFEGRGRAKAAGIYPGCWLLLLLRRCVVHSVGRPT